MEDEPLFYTCWCNYFATGEGSTLMIAMGSTRSMAEKVFINRFGEYFFKGAETVVGVPIIEGCDFLRFVPAYILDMYTIDRIPWLEYSQSHHYNLS